MQDRERCWSEAHTPARARSVPTTCTLYVDSVGYEGLPCGAVPALEHMDCSHTARELAEGLAAEAPGLTAEAAVDLIGELYAALLRAGQQQVFLVRGPGLRMRRPAWRAKKVPRVVVRRDWTAATAAAEAEQDQTSLEL
mmetsp:Transcript_53180/g.152389  ORF Transcript_53180/g.152389 Transcript_53180/m.152389 type:complete len:139 (+) Transcript_53180:1175-1591(+)